MKPVSPQLAQMLASHPEWREYTKRMGERMEDELKGMMASLLPSVGPSGPELARAHLFAAMALKGEIESLYNAAFPGRGFTVRFKSEIISSGAGSGVPLVPDGSETA